MLWPDATSAQKHTPLLQLNTVIDLNVHTCGPEGEKENLKGIQKGKLKMRFCLQVKLLVDPIYNSVKCIQIMVLFSISISIRHNKLLFD